MPASRGWPPVAVLAHLTFVAILATMATWRPTCAFAEPRAVEPIVVEYAADDACLREEAFFSGVRRYTKRWTAVEEGEGLRRFHVTLERRPGGWAGSLVITMPDGQTSRREIPGPDCEAVARGLAIVVVLAIDPAAKVLGPPSEEELADDPAPASAPAPPVDSPPASPPLDVVPLERRRKRRAPPSVPGRPRLGLVFSVEGRAEATSGVVRSALPVIGVAFDARVHVAALPPWLSPSFAVGVRQSLPTEIGVRSGSSVFTWTAATFRLCPVHITAFRDRLDVAPCGELDVGVLDADARDLPQARSTSNRWLGRGASMRLSYRLTRSWSAGAGFLVTVPATRDRFTLATGELISQAAAVGVTGGLAIEMRF